jgi:hypothetical protein
MPPCTYPTCKAPAAGSRVLIAQPEPIEVVLCGEHLRTVDANQLTTETRDFWRWFDAMAGSTG